MGGNKTNKTAEPAQLPRVSIKRRVFLTIKRVAMTRIFLVFACVAVAFFACVGLYNDPSVRDAFYRKYANASASGRLIVRDLYIEGVRHTAAAKARAIVTPYRGMPIFSVPINEIKEKVERLPWVEIALVERLLPSTIAVRIKEHTATALWQYHGAFYLIDAYGEKIVEVNDYAEYGDLILISGARAVESLPALMVHMRNYPKIAERVASASFVGERRWDVYLKNGVLLKLPEDEPDSAMSQIQAMLESGLLEGGRVQTVDLKEGRRIYLLPSDSKTEEAENKG